MADPLTPLLVGNLALFELGQDELASWDAATPNCERLKAVIDTIARQILYSAFWKSGRAVVELTADALLAPLDYEYGYGLDETIVRVWKIAEDCGEGWEVRKPVLCANWGPQIEATIVEFPAANGWSEALQWAVAGETAYRLARKTGADDGEIKRLGDQAGSRLARAKVLEAGEGMPGSAQPTAFLSARR